MKPSIKPLYMLVEITPCKPPPEYVTDVVMNRIGNMEWVDKYKPASVAMLSEEQVTAIKRSES